MGKKNLGAIDGDAALRGLAENFPSARPETPQKQRPTPRAKPKPKPVAEEPEHPLTVRIPMYVAKGLRLAHAETGKSQRLILLEALERWGLEIRKEDLVERRRRRS